MSINLSKNQDYNKQNNFGAGAFSAPESTAQADTLRSMDLPATPDEFVKFVPYVAGAFGISKVFEKLVTSINRVNPFKNKNMTLEQSFQNSPMAKLTQKIDGALLPIAQKFSPQINATKNAFNKYTPEVIKNIIEKFKIGVEPKNIMARSQFYGLTHQSANYFLKDICGKLPKEKLSQLGIESIVSAFEANKIKPTFAVEQISKRLASLPAKDLAALSVTKSNGLFSILDPKKVNLVNELNKTKCFIAKNAKTPITKAIQKSTMSAAEAVSGGMIGGTFGVIMNSIFLASAIRRTWNAPKGEKFSTFMEAALGDFLGGYLAMFFTTKFAYKLLGLKNIDKSAAQLKGIKNLTAKIVADKNNHAVLQRMLKAGVVDAGVLNALGINSANIKNTADLGKFVSSHAGLINSSIDKLAKMKAFKSQGFLKNLIHKPLTMLGNFFSVGLETLPAKIADGKNISAFKAGLMKFKNGFKAFAGYPMRFILVMFVLQSIVQKAFVKFSHNTFGKPTNSVYDEQNKTKPEEKGKINMNDFANYTKLTGLAKMQAQGKLPQQQPAVAVPTQGISQNLINQTLINQQKRLAEPQQVVQPQPQTVAPPVTPQVATSAISPATYIPSSAPAKFTDPNLLAEIDKQFKIANNVEKYVNSELNSLKSGNAYDF